MPLTKSESPIAPSDHHFALFLIHCGIDELVVCTDSAYAVCDISIVVMKIAGRYRQTDSTSLDIISYHI